MEWGGVVGLGVVAGYTHRLCVDRHMEGVEGLPQTQHHDVDHEESQNDGEQNMVSDHLATMIQ